MDTNSSRGSNSQRDLLNKSMNERVHIRRKFQVHFLENEIWKNVILYFRLIFPHRFKPWLVEPIITDHSIYSTIFGIFLN